MKIKFCGAAGEVTGSSHLLIFNDGFKVLLDCGLFQGEWRILMNSIALSFLIRKK